MNNDSKDTNPDNLTSRPSFIVSGAPVGPGSVVSAKASSDTIAFTLLPNGQGGYVGEDGVPRP